MSILFLNWNERPPDGCRGGALSIGNFDGVHRGHQLLIAKARARAVATKGPAVVLTFDPHPLQLLQPDLFQPVLTTIQDRAEYLLHHGADHVVVLRTTWDLLHLEPADFFQRVIQSQLSPMALVEGINFGFGRDRKGSVETLKDLCTRVGIALEIVPPLKTDDGVAISSSRVRSALVRGNLAEAIRLLGRTYRLHGVVGGGQRRGQKLGFPTANLEQIPSLVPGDGVYAVRVVHDNRSWPGAANVGPNPTFGEQERKVEVHLIGFHGDLYGRDLAVEFCHRLRDTRPFSGVDDLVRQLHADIAQARKLLEAS